MHFVLCQNQKYVAEGFAKWPTCRDLVHITAPAYICLNKNWPLVGLGDVPTDCGQVRYFFMSIQGEIYRGFPTLKLKPRDDLEQPYLTGPI